MCDLPHKMIASYAEIRTVCRMKRGFSWRQNLLRVALGLAVIALAVLALRLTDHAMREQALADERADAGNEAAILAASLTSELDKFSVLPLALADDPEVGDLVRSGGRSTTLNRRLERLARQANAAAIYVMDSEGETLAASNWNLPTSFVGSNYAFRTYFSQAITTGSGAQFALGTVSRKPGLYIASRIGTAEAPAGIVAVKVEFDATEERWRRATSGVFVTDPEGVVLLTSEEGWRFRISAGEGRKPRDPQSDLRQFGLANLKPLDIAAPKESGTVVKAALIEASRPIAPVGWELHLLVNPEESIGANVANGRLSLLIALLAALFLLFAMQVGKRRRLAREEQIVAERTRTLTEQLSQANRLATLGQISAGVSHEINQPVAALRVFAENGERLIEAGKTDLAASNFREITGLADRIGKITGELRRFSRRQPGERRVVEIGEVIDGAFLLLQDRIRSRKRGIDLPAEHLQTTEIAVEHIRLEQVLVNLLQNALDATGPDDRIAIALELTDRALLLRVIDEGEGIAPERADTLFQPFATSKEDGLGLGLVISQDIMRDLGGDLLFDGNTGSTTFTMIVPRAA